ncbi:MAG: type II secretion system protein GspK [Desulfotignum sp.]|jgi:general secretion pathway protein K|nr:type II secretion system protein GspK [Desulfotignum sp.]
MKCNPNGMALLVVLGVISVLLATGLHLARLTNKSVIAAGHQTDRFTAREMALSGIHLAMALLADDAEKSDIDSIQEDWADPEILSRITTQLGYTRGQISLEITDEMGKIQANALLQQFPGHTENPDQVRLWEKFIDPLISEDQSRDLQDPVAIINALKDWLDSGDDGAVSGLSGAESVYYSGLSPPYTCADGVLHHVSELLLVKGLNLDLFDSITDNSGPDTQENALENTCAALGDLFTVYGTSDLHADGKTYHYPGRININTAGIRVLAALLPRGMEAFAQDMLDYRAQKSEDGKMFLNPLDKGWYNRVIDLSAKEREIFERMIRYDSNIFTASSTVQLNQARVTLSAYIKRERQKTTNQWICRIIQMERN